MAKPLNILFITADQWRAECLSALRHPTVKTPHLDALAREGVLFANHFANAVPCGPSRTSLHTGMYLQNHRSGTNGTPLEARHTNWAKEAAIIGYDPVLFGYTDTSLDPRELKEDDPWLYTYEGPLPGIRPLVLMGETPTPWTDFLRARGFDVPEPIARAYSHRTAEGPDYEGGAPVPKPLAYPAEVDDTNFLADRCMDYIRSADGPFIAHLSILRPHPPFVAPEPYNALYDPEAVPGFSRLATPEEEGAQHPWLAHQLSRRAFRAPMAEKRMRRMKAVYYGLMREVDDTLGRVFAMLKETGRWDDTMIVFTSDHGEQMGDHWLIGKCGYFDASYRIPLIVRDPRRSADAGRGQVVRRFTENVDIMPTMLEAIGAETPQQCDGRSLSPFLEGKVAPETWRTEAHWEFDFRDPADDAAEKALGLTMHQCSMNIIRDERFKYVHFTKLPPLLFDLEKDPGEFVNRANDPHYVSVMLEYAQKLLSWRMNHDEQVLTHISLTHKGPVSRPVARY
jgi:arylsulfatase A-like enzyme